MFTLNVLEDCGYGCFLLSDGEHYIWDFDVDGVSGILQRNSDGVVYGVVDVIRDSNDNACAFTLEI